MKLDTLDRALARIESGFIVTAILTLVVLSTFQIIARNVFNYGLPGLDVLLRILVLWIAFFGASLATARKRHIAIDAIGNLLSDKWKKIASIITGSLAGMVCVFLSSASWDFMQSEMEFGGELVWGMKNWWFQTILPFGFALIAFRFLLNVLVDSADLCGWSSSETVKTDGE